MSTCKDQSKIMEILNAIIARKEEFTEMAMNLYNIKMDPNDKRPAKAMMREAYLDFNSKSLYE